MEDIKIIHDNTICVATAGGRKEIQWRNKETTWSDFVAKLSPTNRTAETIAEYQKLSKTRQDEIKDVGGFVGGYLGGGRRKKGHVSYRSLATLDIDFADGELWDDYEMLFGEAAVVYSTHKHTPEKPRLRLIMPLSRTVTAEEYEPVCRYIASKLGIDKFDDTTYEAERLMYWPSTSKDGEYVFRYQDGPWLDVDGALGTYIDWRDCSCWPVSSRSSELIHKSIKKQEDPTEKSGLIGAFCRTYTISEAIETFLPDEYTPCDVDNRYTYVHGSTAAGLVVYDDKYAFSHHSTDPTSGHLCNAFDLVRLHKFGNRDDNVSDRTNASKYPSFIAMEEFISRDKSTRSTYARERAADAGADFADVDPDSDEATTDWMADAETDRKGKWLCTPGNIDLVLQHDHRLRGCFVYDVFNDRKALAKLPPWRKADDRDMMIRDDDEANLRKFLSMQPYGIDGRMKIVDGLDIVCRQNSFHPVRHYMDGLTWDGTPRLDALIIEYLGAEDTPLNRAMTRSMFTAAVYRTYEPGTKFDQIIVLVGTQGCGKSTLLERMAIDLQWFSSSMPSPDDPVKAATHLRGKFLIEIAELVGFRKAEVEAIKNFLSRTSDDYRAPYARNEVHRPRQCVFFATTNEQQFLRDSSGERRYWPIQVSLSKPIYSVWEDLTPDVVAQIWAEAVHHYRQRQSLLLSTELYNQLAVVQNAYKVSDEWEGVIEAFLNRKLPANWEAMSADQRRAYFHNTDELQAEAVHPRKKVCVMDVLNECPGMPNIATVSRQDRSRIARIINDLSEWRKKDGLYTIFGRQKGWVRNIDTETSLY